jgi:hypothetical protein
MSPFGGETYDREIDGRRLLSQLESVRRLMVTTSPRWWTLGELHAYLGYPEASISARLRDLRKVKFGSYRIERRRRIPLRGTWEYALVRDTLF